MGMYTTMRGWIRVDSDYETFEDDFKKLMIDAEKISERASQCVYSSVANVGFNMECYIFIGGDIKNYDDDWNKFIDFLRRNFEILEMRLEERYEENDDWNIIDE